MEKKDPLLRRIIKSRAFNVVIIAVVMCVPLLYAGLLTWTYQKPMDNLSHMDAAIVNLDKEATQYGPQGNEKRSFNVGQELVDRLTDPADGEDVGFTWHVTSEKKAQAGLDDGTYLAVLTIPADVSESVSKLDSQDATEAAAQKLQLTTNDGVSYLAGTMARTVADELQGNVRENANIEITKALVGSFATVHDSLNEAADGAGQLADGAGQLATGASELATGNGKLATGATQLVTGTQKLNSGAGQISNGAGQLNSGATQLVSGATALEAGLTTLQQKTAALPTQATQLNAGAKKLATGASALSAGAKNLSAGVNQLTTVVKQSATAAQALAKLNTPETQAALQSLQGAGTALQGMQSNMTTAVGACQQIQQDPQLSQVESLKTLCSGITGMASSAQALQQAQGAMSALAPLANVQIPDTSALNTPVTDPADPSGKTKTDPLTALQHGAAAVQNGAAALQSGATQLSAGTQTLADSAPALSGGIAQAASGASALKNGAAQLSTGTKQLYTASVQLTSGTGQLLTGAQALSTGAQTAASGANKLNEGAKTAADGAKELATKLADGAKDVPNYDSAQQDKIAKTAAKALSVKAVRANAVENNGAGFSPFFMSLALWIGGIAAYFIFPALDKRRKGDKWYSCALRSFGVAALVGLGQALLVGLIVGPLVGISGAAWPALIGMLMITSLAFVAANQGLLALLGFRGRFFSVLLLVLQISAMGATFPIVTAPGFMQVISPWLPMTHTAAALRTIIAGQGLSVWPAVGFIVATLVISVAVTLASAWATRKQAEPNDDPTVQFTDTAVNAGPLGKFVPASILN